MKKHFTQKHNAYEWADHFHINILDPVPIQGLGRIKRKNDLVHRLTIEEKICEKIDIKIKFLSVSGFSVGENLMPLDNP